MTNNKQSSDNNKDVIYLDVDEDITGIIAKVRGSGKRIIALVLPKRFATMQSTVNMKLLKRAAERDKKHLVLITAEASLLPLAGAAGLHVAKTLQSKPEVPELPLGAAEIPDEDVEEAVSETEPSVDKTKSLQELSGVDEDEDNAPIELDNQTAVDNPKGSKKSKVKAKKDKRLKIPNFNKFRTWLIFGGLGLIVLVAGLIWALAYAPKAEILVNTDSTAVTASGEITLNLDEAATLNTENGIVPGTVTETKRRQTAEVETSGEKNNGKKATGSVVMKVQNCETPSTPNSVPAGTGVTSNGKTYVTQSKADFSFEDFEDDCLTFTSGNVKIAAQNAGSDHNTGGSSQFTVAGRAGVSANGSAKGGTDDIIKIATQADIDKAKDKIKDQDDDEVVNELSKQLQSQGDFVVSEILITDAGESTSNVQPDEKAEKVTVTQEVTYKMLGVKRDDLEKLIASMVGDKIDSSKQAILDYGLDEASFTLQNQTGNDALIGMHTVVTAGPDLNVDEIKTQVAGLKSSEAKPIIEDYPGVVGVDISYGPFWVSSIPKNTGKITITIEEPEVVEDNSEDVDAAE
jgi:hypothetical protein